MPITLIELAKLIRPIVVSAVNDLGPDLQGFSLLDLVLDNLDEDIKVSFTDIRAALVVAGIDHLVSSRLARMYSL